MKIPSEVIMSGKKANNNVGLCSGKGQYMCLNCTSYDVQYSLIRLSLTKHGTCRNLVMFSNTQFRV